MTDDSEKLGRREFLVAAYAATTLAGCASHKEAPVFPLPHITAAQAAKKRQARSKVALVACPSYEENILSLIKPYIKDAELPDLKGKRTVIKPNLVEFEAGHPITTHPKVLEAAVQLANYLGAKEIIVAEGPGHMRDTEYLLEATGIGAACKKLGVPFVDLNVDDLEKVSNADGLTGLKEFFLPRTITSADAVISLPKLKTHHWMGVTCSMKNLFGCAPGRRYGWPKNILHVKGIPQSIIDLVHLVKPTFGFVDAIVSMEGDGPIMGTEKHSKFVAFGVDVAALDASCIRTMAIEPFDLPYIKLASQTVGHIDTSMIDLVALPIDKLKLEFKKPITMTHKEFLAHADQEAS